MMRRSCASPAPRLRIALFREKMQHRPSRGLRGGRRSEDRFQDHPPVREERHEQTQRAAHDDGRDLAVLGMHPDEHEALDRQDRGGHNRERRAQWKTAGTISPTVQTSSRMPRAVQASRGNAPKDGTSLLTLSNMKTFMTPDAPYRSAARACRTHNRMFIVVPPPGFRVGAGRLLRGI